MVARSDLTVVRFQSGPFSGYLSERRHRPDEQQNPGTSSRHCDRQRSAAGSSPEVLASASLFAFRLRILLSALFTIFRWVNATQRGPQPFTRFEPWRGSYYQIGTRVARVCQNAARAARKRAETIRKSLGSFCGPAGTARSPISDSFVEQGVGIQCSAESLTRSSMLLEQKTTHKNL